jgi:predicted transcriptional regulator
MDNVTVTDMDNLKDDKLSMRLRHGLKAKLQMLADAQHRKLSNYIEKVLIDHVESESWSSTSILRRGKSVVGQMKKQEKPPK